MRLEDSDLKGIKEFSKETGFDQSTTIKQALKKGLLQLKADFAIQKYAAHKVTLSSAARIAGISLWEFLEELKKKNAFVQTDEESLEKSLKEFE